MSNIVKLADHTQEIILPMDIVRANLFLGAAIAKHFERADMNTMLATRVHCEDGYERNGYQALVYIRNSLNATIQRYDNSLKQIMSGRA